LQPLAVTGILINAVSGDSEYGLRILPPPATTLVVGNVLAVCCFAAGGPCFVAGEVPEFGAAAVGAGF